MILLAQLYLVGLIFSCQLCIHCKRAGWQHDSRARVMLRVLAWPYWVAVSVGKLG